MGKEIERKFLVKGDAWKALAPGIRYRQGYLNSSIDRTVRVRTIGDQGFITVKGPNNGIARQKYELKDKDRTPSAVGVMTGLVHKF